MGRWCFLFVSIVVFVTGCGRHGANVVPSINSRFSTLRGASPNIPSDWLAQKICVDANDNPVAMDPYSSSDPFGNGCAGYTERNIRWSDGVPYYRYTVPLNWYTYAYAVTTPQGEQMFVHIRELTPQNNPPSNWYVNPTYYPGETHWDLYRLLNGWVSIGSTRDTGGFNQIFFGNTGGSATPYNGWITAPLAYFSTLGASASTSVPISGLNWEQMGTAWPVPQQPAPNSTDTQTTWKLVTGFRFDSGKQMNALMSYHQSAPQPNASNPETGHMEIFYYTMPYGPSRWEVWSAARCLKTGACAVSTTQQCNPAKSRTFLYRGSSYAYYRIDCIDWTRTAVASAGSTLPIMPVPETNLLSNMHFSSDPPNMAGSATAWNVGSDLTLTQLSSALPADTNNGQFAGVRYVKFSCNGVCTSLSSLSQAVPLSASGTYAYGADARVENGTGSIAVTLSEIDANGNVLSTADATTTTVNQYGYRSACNAGPTSVVLCDSFVGRTAAVNAVPGAVGLRLTIAPLTAGAQYDVPDAYLARLSP